MVGLVFLLLNIAGIFVGFLTAFTLTIYFCKCSKRGNFPWILWYLWIFVYHPYVYILAFGTMALSISQLIDNSLSSKFSIILLCILNFSEQQIRGSFFITICERLFATIFLESYTKVSRSKLLVFFLTSLTYCLSFGYTYLVMFGLSDKYYRDFLATGIILFIHALASIGCKILQIKNCAMYKMLAYRITLRKRYQILENIKALSIIWYAVLVLSMVSPLGSIWRLCYYFIAHEHAYPNVHYLTYNLAFILLQVQCIKLINKIKDIEIHTVDVVPTSVIGPMGNQLPVNVTTDTYFKNLKDQWG